MKRLFPLVTIAVLAAATIVWAQSPTQATVSSPAGERPVAMFLQGAQPMLAAEDVMAALGGKLTAESHGYRMSLGGVDAVFGTDSRFAVVKDDLIEMPQPPTVVDGKVFVAWQLIQGYLRVAGHQDVAWDGATKTLSVKPAPAELLSAQVSVVDLQNLSKLVVQLSGPTDYTIAREGINYVIRLRNPVRAPFAEQAYDDPRIARIQFHDRDVTVQLRNAAIAGDAYRLENPFRIIVDLKEGVAATSPSLPSLPSPTHAPEAPGIRTIVLDPGHGGRDVGALGPNGVSEKDITLALCKKLQPLLAAKLGARVLLTRTTDELISLDQRTALANQYKADLFLSVHLNASLMKGARGSETYFLSVEASDELARKAAERENSSQSAQAPSGDKSSDLRLILWDLAQQEYLKESSRFAEIVQDEMNRAFAVQNRGVKQAPFKVLVGATMPAALVEVGFISNPDEETKLVDDAFQTTIVAALAQAVDRYKTEYETRMGLIAPAAAAPATAASGQVAPPAASVPSPARPASTGAARSQG